MVLRNCVVLWVKCLLDLKLMVLAACFLQGVVHKDNVCFLPLPLSAFFSMWLTLPLLQTSASSIVHLSTVWSVTAGAVIADSVQNILK